MSAGVHALQADAGFHKTSPQDDTSTEHRTVAPILPAQEPRSFAGPEVKLRPTVVKVFTPSQLAGSPLLPSLHKVINDAFHFGHFKDGAWLIKLDRLRHDGHFMEQLGTAEGTFTFILHYADTTEVLATAGAKRWAGNVDPTEELLRDPANTWKRLGVLPPEAAAWELSLLAVDPQLMRQGLAGLLMKLVEEEIQRLFKLAQAERSKEPEGVPLTRLWLMANTIKEQNEEFYSKRGYEKVYEVKWEKGCLGSDNGFHVLHATKELVS